MARQEQTKNFLDASMSHDERLRRLFDIVEDDTLHATGWTPERDGLVTEDLVELVREIVNVTMALRAYAVAGAALPQGMEMRVNWRAGLAADLMALLDRAGIPLDYPCIATRTLRRINLHFDCVPGHA
jgi:hypothetical protein